MKNTLGMGITGYYKLWIVDPDGTSHLQHEGKNLILNQGMDLMATTYGGSWNLLGFAGNGNRVNKIPSGDSSASVANGWLTLTTGSTGLQNFSSSWATSSYGYTSSLWLGDIVKFADGTEVMISGSYSSSIIGGIVKTIATESISDLSASIKSGTPNVQTQSFTIWKTSQTGLHNLLKRAGTGITTSSYLLSPSNSNGTHYSSSEMWIKHWRTYDFGSENYSCSYSEIGVGSSVAENTIFSRVVLPTTVSLNPQQRLRLRHEFHIQYNPTSSINVINAPINGWPVAPSDNTNITQSLQRFISGLFSTINSSAATVLTNNEVLETPKSVYIWGSGNTSSLATPGSYVDKYNNSLGVYQSVSSVSVSYIPWRFELIKYGIFTFSQLNGANISSFGFGASDNNPSYNPASTGCVFAMVFEQTQSKFNTQRLTMYFKWNWNRVLDE